MINRNLLLSALASGAMLFGLAGASAQGTKTAIFAGGCFWCVESDFDHVEGVLETVSGYTGGTTENPTYRDVTAGGTGHYEAVQVTYDPGKVTYDELLKVFWHSVDPTDAGGQFCDRGDSYRTAVFAADPEQMQKAEATKAEVAAQLKQPVATAVTAASTFYPAEDYHQDYYLNNSLKYKYYRYSCGRDARINEVWGDDAFLGIKDKMS